MNKTAGKCRLREDSISGHATSRIRVRAMVEADEVENQLYLDAIKRGDLSPRSPQGRAALLLRRVAKRCGAIFEDSRKDGA